MQKNNRNIYLISGLGADERVFKHLKLDAESTTYIKWLEIGKYNSKMAVETYASRLLGNFIHPNPIIIGISFGGIIALEIAKQIPTSQVIIISSIKSNSEMPFVYKVFKYLPLYRIIPFSILKQFNGIAAYIFGIKDIENKELLYNIIAETNPVFFKWALNVILNWDCKINELPNSKTINLTHIHGTKDIIFPIKYTKNVIKIVGGGHLMTLTHNKEISEIINNLRNNNE